MLEGTAERAPDGVPRGAYMLVDEPGGDARPRADRHRLRGVGVRRRARAARRRRAVGVRVVSMPSWDLFAAQDARGTATAVLPPGVPDARGRGRVELRVGALRGRRASRSTTSARRPRATSCSSEFGFTPEQRRRARPARCSLPTTAASEDHRRGDAHDQCRSPSCTSSGRAPGTTTSTRVLADRRRPAASSSTTTASAASRRTRRSSRRPWPPATATTSSSRESRGGGPVDRGHVLGARPRRHRARGRRAAPGVRRDSAAPTASCRSRSTPDLAHDTDADRSTQAQELFATARPAERDDQDPGHAEGLPAITETIAAGINVNVTLIFSLARHDEVIEAYLAGLEQLADAGGDLVERHVGRVVLREPGRHRDRPAPPRGSPAAGQGRGRQREARVPAVPSSGSRASAGTRSRRRARGCSGRCGRRRRRRTPPTPPRSTSTS